MGAYADLLPDSDTPAKKTSLSSSSVTPNVAAFVEQYAPVAERVAAKTGNDPSLYLAQWGLETGWGKSVIPGTNNLGNIKDFSGSGITAKDNHTGSVDKYRKYDTSDAFADDYAGLLGRRYKSALNVGNNMEAFAHELKRNGYAEDPSYVAKLKAAHSMISGRLPEKQEPSVKPNQRGEFEPQTDYSAAFERFASVPDSTLQAQIAADAQPKEEDGFFSSMGRGFKSTWPQTKQLLSGAGALAADTLGFDDARDYLMESYANAEKEVQALSKPTDSWTDQGSKNLGNFIGYWTGYMGGQLAESMASAVAGGAVGSAAGGAGAVPGALGGFLLKTEAKAAIAEAAKTMAEAATKKALEKGLTKEAATLEAKQVADAFVKTATQRAVGKQIGTVGGMGVQNFGMETGEIYGDLYQKAKREGREVTDEERSSAWLYGTLAGAMETVADKFNLDAVMGGGAKGAGIGKRLAGFGREAGKAELRENVTELAQTGLERAGKGEEVNPFLGTPESDKAYNEYVDTVAGTTAGSWIPGLGGLRVAQQQKAKQDAAAQQAPKPNSPLENAAKAAGAVPLLGHDPSVLNPLEQNIGPAPLEGEWMPADGGEKPALESPNAMTDRKGQVVPSENRFTMGEGEAPSTAKGFRQRSEKTIAGLLNAPRAMLTQQQQQVIDQSLVEYEAAYQDLVKAEQLGASDQELMQRQINLRNAEARLQELNQLIEGNRQVSTSSKRDELLSRVLASNPQNPNRAFDRALRLEGFNDLNFTEAEKAKIARFGELRQMQDDTAPSLPNEGQDFGIKAKPEQAATTANQNVANMLNAGWQLQGKQLVSPKGEKYNLKAGELLFVRNKLQQKAKPTGDRVASSIEQVATQAQEANDAQAQQEPAAAPTAEGLNTPVQQEYAPATEQSAPVGESNEGRQEQPVLQAQNAEPAGVSDQGQGVTEPTQAAENVPGTAQAPNVTEPAEKERYAVGNNNTVIVVQPIHDVTYPQMPGRLFFTRQTEKGLFNVIDAKSGWAVFLDAASEDVAISNFAVRMQELGLDRVKERLESLPDIQAPQQEEVAPQPVKPSLDAIKRKYKGESNIKKIDGLISAGSITNQLLKSGLDADALPFRDLEFSEQNWREEFGANQSISTPIGVVKIGEGQHAKAKEKSRTNEFGLIKPTLESPSLIVEFENPKEGADRQTSMMFVKAFKRDDGTKYFTSITVLQGDIEVSVSSHFKRVNQIGGEVRSGVLRYSATAFTDAVTSGQFSNPAADKQPNGASEPSLAEDTDTTSSEAEQPAAVDSDFERGKAMMAEGIDKLIGLLGGKTNMLPEEEAQIIPVMSQIFRGAALMGYAKFKEASRFVLDTLRAKSPAVADKIELKNLQAAYININGFGGDPDVASMQSIDELYADRDALNERIATAEERTAVNPTDAQKESGVYPKGKFAWNGMTISIETVKNNERSGIDEDGSPWSVTAPFSYGYFLGTTAADNEHLDVYIGDKPESDRVYVINQTKVDSPKFDEHKVLIGFDSEEAAKEAYFKAFTDGFAPRVFGSMSGPYSVDEFKAMLPKLEKAKFLSERVTDKSERLVADEKRKYEETVARAKAKAEERALVPLDQITVTRTSKLDGKEVEYDQQADQALSEIDKQMTLGKQLLECLAS